LTTGRRKFLATITVGAAMTAAGCQSDRGPISIDSDDPDRRILAVKRDVAEHSLKDAPGLVNGLSDDDAAVRFYCIEGLRRLTGEDFGYCYHEDPDRRAPAVSRWRQWLAGRK
jgi:hypothetical protein